MTEADVETVVKKAEVLWEQALDMRKQAEELSSQVSLPPSSLLAGPPPSSPALLPPHRPSSPGLSIPPSLKVPEV